MIGQQDGIGLNFKATSHRFLYETDTLAYQRVQRYLALDSPRSTEGRMKPGSFSGLRLAGNTIQILVIATQQRDEDEFG
ncbi:hypothetical protein [Mycolicibacterium sarraceniae]|uniref:hypothetical protein n=1 Tax=Mycolicibacterium sarraceniae TaxID=1534348 RepID=UPI0013D654F2|nr:hypothetical protein [Mycolicibacterium sarraceniae]